MPNHTLVIGGSGMLAEATLWLANRGDIVSVIARNEEKMEQLRKNAKHPENMNLIRVDYRKDKDWFDTLRNLQQKYGTPSLVVSWIHSDAPKAYPILFDVIGNQSKTHWRLFEVRGSASALSQKRREVPKKCLYRLIILGFIRENGLSRWLTNHEISRGVIDAIKKDQTYSVVGQIEPWDLRP